MGFHRSQQRSKLISIKIMNTLLCCFLPGAKSGKHPERVDTTEKRLSSSRQGLNLGCVEVAFQPLKDLFPKRQQILRGNQVVAVVLQSDLTPFYSQSKHYLIGTKGVENTERRVKTQLAAACGKVLLNVCWDSAMNEDQIGS